MEFDNLIQIRCSEFDYSLNIYPTFDDVLLSLMCFQSLNKLDYHIKAINGSSKNNLDKLTISFRNFENQNFFIEPYVLPRTKSNIISMWWLDVATSHFAQ